MAGWFYCCERSKWLLGRPLAASHQTREAIDSYKLCPCELHFRITGHRMRPSVQCFSPIETILKNTTVKLMTLSGKPSRDFCTASFLISTLYLIKHINQKKYVVSQHQAHVDNWLGHCYETYVQISTTTGNRSKDSRRGGGLEWNRERWMGPDERG